MTSPKEIGRRWFDDVWNRRSVETIRELLSPDATGHLEGGIDIIGPEPFIAFRQLLLTALPDLRVEVAEIIAEGENVCVRWSAVATHTGEGLGLPPSGKKARFRGTTWLRIVDGRIVEGWDNWNQGGLMAALS